MLQQSPWLHGGPGSSGVSWSNQQSGIPGSCHRFTRWTKFRVGWKLVDRWLGRAQSGCRWCGTWTKRVNRFVWSAWNSGGHRPKKTPICQTTTTATQIIAAGVLHIRVNINRVRFRRIAASCTLEASTEKFQYVKSCRAAAQRYLAKADLSFRGPRDTPNFQWPLRILSGRTHVFSGALKNIFIPRRPNCVQVG